jgi:phage shock protein C
MHIGWIEVALLLAALVVLPLLLGVVLLVLALVTVSRRSHRSQEVQRARISQEIERIRALQASGRISAAESTELMAALEDRRAEGASSASPKRLHKSRSPVLAGVCGGLAEWLDWEPTLVRVGYVLATLLIAGFPGIIIYLIMALVIPRHPEAQPANTGRILLLILLLVLVPLGLLLGAGSCLFVSRPSRSVGAPAPMRYVAPARPPAAF